MFVPVEEVGVNDEIKIEQFLTDEGMDILFSDIISGRVNPVKNCCCKKSVPPEKLSYVDLSPILPKFKIDKDKVKKDTALNRTAQLKIIDEEER